MRNSAPTKNMKATSILDLTIDTIFDKNTQRTNREREREMKLPEEEKRKMNINAWLVKSAVGNWNSFFLHFKIHSSSMHQNSSDRGETSPYLMISLSFFLYLHA